MTNLNKPCAAERREQKRDAAFKARRSEKASRRGGVLAAIAALKTAILVLNAKNGNTSAERELASNEARAAIARAEGGEGK